MSARKPRLLTTRALTLSRLRNCPPSSLRFPYCLPMMEIAPEQVEVGRHGLLISQGARRGLLLPQVAVEWKWDREQFLEQTCLKAGLPRDAWRHGARIQAFTAQVLKEPLQPECSGSCLPEPSLEA